MKDKPSITNKINSKVGRIWSKEIPKENTKAPTENFILGMTNQSSGFKDG
jgi:hypothetical protein